MTLPGKTSNIKLASAGNRSVFGATAVIAAIAAIAALVTMSGIGQSIAAPKVGTTSSVQGTAYVLTDGARRKAQVRSSIELNDQVQTKDNSALQIMLLDQTTFTVGQNCTIVIDEFVYDPNTSIGDLSAQVFTGAFRYMTGKIGQSNPINASINTPSASIGIRGTFFEGIVGEDAVALASLGGIDTSGADMGKASITILRGSGRGSNTLDKSGSVTVTSAGVTKSILEPGFAIFSPGPGQPPIGPFRMTDQMREYLDFFLRSTPNGPSENPFPVASGSQESGQHQFENEQEGTEPQLDEGGEEGTEDDLLEREDDNDEYEEEDDGEEEVEEVEEVEEEEVVEDEEETGDVCRTCGFLTDGV